MRLTKKIIDQVVEAAVEKSGIPTRKKVIAANKTKLVEKLRKRLVPEGVIAKISEAEKLRENVNKDIDGLVVGMAFNFQDGMSFRCPVSRRREYWGFQDGLNHPVPQGFLEKLTKAEKKAVSKLFSDTDEAIDAQEKLSRTIINSCQGVTTTAKLIELWPGAEGLIPVVEKKQMLAVQSKEIDAMISKKY